MDRMKEPRTGVDALGQIEAAVEELRALEARIRGVEDVLTSGDAQQLPAVLPSGEARDLNLRLIETALQIGALARRMNIRLGAVERALEGRGPVGLADMAKVRSRRRLRVSEPTRRRIRIETQIRLLKDGAPTRPN
jgi:hypothetical protein